MYFVAVILPTHRKWKKWGRDLLHEYGPYESGFMPARRRYAGYLDDADGAKIGDGRVQVA